MEKNEQRERENEQQKKRDMKSACDFYWPKIKAAIHIFSGVNIINVETCRFVVIFFSLHVVVGISLALVLAAFSGE